MKILYVANVAAEHFCKFYINEFRELSKKGWIIEIACHMDADVPFVSCAYPMPWNRNPFHLSTFKGIRMLANIIEKNQYDIVYCTTPIGGLIGRLAVKKVKNYHPAVIYIAHGFHFFKGSSPFSWILYYPVEKWLAKYTDVLITVNSEDYEFALKKLKVKRIEKINEVGANVALYSDTKPSLQEINEIKENIGVTNFYPVLFYAAEISDLKNQKYLLEVVGLLIKKGFNPALVLAGRDQTKGKFARRVSQMRLNNRVKLIGFRQDLPALIHIADFCTPASKREGLGLNVVEAMAAGIPVVAVDNRGHRETIKNSENGYLVSIKKPQEMVNRIIALSKDEKSRESIISAVCLKDIRAFDKTAFRPVFA